MANLPPKESYFPDSVTQAFLTLGDELDKHSNIKFVGIVMVSDDDLNHLTSIKTDNVGMLESVLLLDKGMRYIRAEYGANREKDEDA